MNNKLDYIFLYGPVSKINTKGCSAYKLELVGEWGQKFFKGKKA